MKTAGEMINLIYETESRLLYPLSYERRLERTLEECKQWFQEFQKTESEKPEKTTKTYAEVIFEASDGTKIIYWKKNGKSYCAVCE